MATARTWSRADFTEQLYQLERYYHANHPYQRLMHEGALSQTQMQGWVANRYYYQVSVPMKDAALLANCPEREIRRSWIQRLLDHDGDADGSGGIEAWIQLGLAVGLSREDVVSQRYVLPGVRFAVDAYVNFVRQADWLDGVCSSLTELFAPTIHRERLESWPRHYPWIDSRGLDYFRNRVGQAHRDVEHGLEIVLSRCDTADKQRRAVDILRFKLEVLWSMLDAMYMAYVLQMPPFHHVENASWAPRSTDKALYG